MRLNNLNITNGTPYSYVQFSIMLANFTEGPMHKGSIL